MPDARCTRGLARNVHRECAHEHTGERRLSGIPCAMALRLTPCSPRWSAFLPPSPAGLAANLTPASRRQDHTSSPYASATLVSRGIRVHRIPLPTFVTIAKRPSYRQQDGKHISLIYVS